MVKLSVALIILGSLLLIGAMATADNRPGLFVAGAVVFAAGVVVLKAFNSGKKKEQE